MWWKSIWHVSLVEPSFLPKKPSIGLEVQIPDLFERPGPAENFQDLMKKYLYFPLHGGFPCGHLIRQYPLIFLSEGRDTARLGFCPEGRNAMALARPGFESGPFDLEFSALTITPPWYNEDELDESIIILSQIYY